MLSIPAGKVLLSMEQAKRGRTRPIRTIGRLTERANDDILLAQWSSEEQEAAISQDVALDLTWQGVRPLERNRRGSPLHPETMTSVRASVLAFERHQLAVIARLRHAIEVIIHTEAEPSIVFESPPESLDGLLRRIDLVVANGELSRQRGREISDRCRRTGECVARLHAVADLYRRGYLAKCELDTKQRGIMADFERIADANVPDSDRRPNRATMAD